MRKITRVWVISVLLMAVVPGVRATAADPNASTREAVYITSADGTKLRTWVYKPADLAPGDKTPVILNVTPYAGSAGSFFFTMPPDVTNSDVPPAPGGLAVDGRIFERGYSLVVVELRGYGGSGGCYDFGGKGEQADAKAAVEWAASQPWSTGKVGMYGHSYEGEAQMMALATRPKGLAAVIASAPPTGYRNLYTNGVRNFGGGTAFGAFYAASDAYPASLGAPLEETTTSLEGTATHPTCYAEVVGGSYSNDPQDAYWKERDLVGPNVGHTVPTMLVHGFNDFNVRPTAFMGEYSTLDGPRRGFFGPWDHGIPRNGKLFVDEQMAWFDRWLKGIVASDRVPVSVQDVSGRTRAEEDWPPPDAVDVDIPLRTGMYLNAPGNNGETGLPAQFPLQPPQPLPAGRGVWSISQPLEHPVHLSGLPSIEATISSLGPANVIALIYDIDAAGNARFVDRGAHLAPGAGTFRFDLYPVDHRFEAGSRIGVLLTGADDVWFEPSGIPGPVEVTSATLVAPVLHHDRSTFLETGPFRPRTPHAPFAVGASTIASSEIAVDAPAPVGDVDECTPHGPRWWERRSSSDGFPAVAERAAVRSYGTFDDGASVAGALSASALTSADRNFAAHLLNLAAADVGSLDPFGGLEPSSGLDAGVYDLSVVGDTARAATYWLSTALGTQAAAKVARSLVMGSGVACGV